jgi:uncharacterized protein YbjT (DUF2867 family)
VELTGRVIAVAGGTGGVRRATVGLERLAGAEVALIARGAEA